MKPASSISCDAVRRSASSFLDGRMSARERGAAQRHLRACTACMGELQQLARLSRAMHNLPPHRVADGMAQRLRRQHDGSLATPADRSVTQWAAPRGSRIARRIAAAALAAAALPLVFWLGYRSGRAAAPQLPVAPTPGAAAASSPIAERSPAPPPAPALQPRVRPATPSPQLDEPSPPGAHQAPFAAPSPAPSPASPDARLAVDPNAPTSNPAPESPLDEVHRMMERMMRELQAQTRRW